MAACKALDSSNGQWWLVNAYALSQVVKMMPEESRRDVLLGKSAKKRGTTVSSVHSV